MAYSRTSFSSGPGGAGKRRRPKSATARVTSNQLELENIMTELSYKDKEFVKKVKNLQSVKEELDENIKSELKQTVKCSLDDFIKLKISEIDEDKKGEKKGTNRKKKLTLVERIQSVKEDGANKAPNTSRSYDTNNDIRILRVHHLVAAKTDVNRRLEKSLLKRSNDKLKRKKGKKQTSVKTGESSERIWSDRLERCYNDFKNNRVSQKMLHSPSLLMSIFLSSNEFRKANKKSKLRLAAAKYEKKLKKNKKKEQVLQEKKKKQTKLNLWPGREESMSTNEQKPYITKKKKNKKQSYKNELENLEGLEKGILSYKAAFRQESESLNGIKMRRKDGTCKMTFEEQHIAKIEIASKIVCEHKIIVSEYLIQRDIFLKKKTTEKKDWVENRCKIIQTEFDLKKRQKEFKCDVEKTRRRLRRLDIKVQSLKRGTYNRPPPGYKPGSNEELQQPKIANDEQKKDLEKAFGIAKIGFDMERTEASANEYCLLTRDQGGGNYRNGKKFEHKRRTWATVHMQRMFRGRLGRMYTWAVRWLQDPLHQSILLGRYEEAKNQISLRELGSVLREMGHPSFQKLSESFEAQKILDPLNTGYMSSESFRKFWKHDRKRDISILEMLNYVQVVKGLRKREILYLKSRGLTSIPVDSPEESLDKVKVPKEGNQNKTKSAAKRKSKEKFDVNLDEIGLGTLSPKDHMRCFAERRANDWLRSRSTKRNRKKNEHKVKIKDGFVQKSQKRVNGERESKLRSGKSCGALKHERENKLRSAKSLGALKRSKPNVSQASPKKAKDYEEDVEISGREEDKKPSAIEKEYKDRIEKNRILTALLQESREELSIAARNLWVEKNDAMQNLMSFVKKTTLQELDSKADKMIRDQRSMKNTKNANSVNNNQIFKNNQAPSFTKPSMDVVYPVGSVSRGISDALAEMENGKAVSSFSYNQNIDSNGLLSFDEFQRVEANIESQSNDSESNGSLQETGPWIRNKYEQDKQLDELYSKVFPKGRLRRIHETKKQKSKAVLKSTLLYLEEKVEPDLVKIKRAENDHTRTISIKDIHITSSTEDLTSVKKMIRLLNER